MLFGFFVVVFFRSRAKALLTHEGGWDGCEKELLAPDGDSRLWVLHFSHQRFHLKNKQNLFVGFYYLLLK